MLTEPNWQQVKEVFGGAIELPPEEWPRFLSRACGEDAALRREVESLLAVSGDGGSGPTIDAATAHATVGILTETAGTRIGRYRLRRRVGEGGFGAVFEAEQEEPVRRLVALKVIKLGMDTRAVIARFEAERQALAMMDHPNIARVLDAGATDAGRPYFVMELVEGAPVTRYCQQHNADLRQRLSLFVAICSAVQHAHQKGVIHRDIKPGNVLASTVDGRPFVKVIDFGIAKAIEARPGEASSVSIGHPLIGTPQYMSPEQARGGPDVDTRADVYGLGVLLYELLSGATPFDASELRDCGPAELQRVICERVPPPPSRHNPALPCELDWIVGRAIEKDRSRRYYSPGELAADVERFLRDEPIAAGPPSRWYRAKKLLRRHRSAFVAAGVVLLTLCLGIAGTTLSLFSAWRAQAAAEANERVARTESGKSAQVTKFLREMLGGVQAGVALGRDTALLREMLDRAAGRVEMELRDQPEIAAALHATIGDLYRQVGELSKAEPILVNALEVDRRLRGENDPQTAEAWEALGALRWEQARPREAEEALQEALRIYRAADPPRLEQMGRALCVLSKYLHHLARVDEAAAAGGEGLGILESLFGAESLAVADARAALAAVRHAQQDLVAAETLHRQALETRRRRLGARHPDVAKSLTHLADLALKRQAPEEAIPLVNEAAEIAREVFQDAPAELRYVLEVRSKVMGFSPRAADWVAAARELMELCVRVDGENSANAAQAYYDYGIALRVANDLNASEAALRRAVEISAAIPALGPTERADILGLLGFVLGQQAGTRWQTDFAAAEQYAAESEAALRAALDALAALNPPQAIANARIEAGLGALLTMVATQEIRRGQCAEALGKARQAAAYLESVNGVYATDAPDEPSVVINQAMFGRALAAVADAAEASARGCNGGAAPADAGELLADALQHCRRAETVLEAACEANRAQRAMAEAVRLPRLRSCYFNLAELHEIWERVEPNQGHIERAAQWREQAAAVPPPQ